MRILLISVAILLLNGCASANIHRDVDGNVWKIDIKGNGSASYERGDEKWSINGKWTDIFKGIVNLNKI